MVDVIRSIRATVKDCHPEHPRIEVRLQYPRESSHFEERNPHIEHISLSTHRGMGYRLEESSAARQGESNIRAIDSYEDEEMRLREGSRVKDEECAKEKGKTAQGEEKAPVETPNLGKKERAQSMTQTVKIDKGKGKAIQRSSNSI